MQNKSGISNIYRNELDGLRAFAVIAVIINHFNKNLLESGYLGVDIFFVISGYVITSSLINKRLDGFKNFIISFYQRRIKRLLPALIFYIVIAILLIWILNPYPRESLRTGFASIFGFSNLYLFKNSVDYFSNSTELNPFTHTWSLAVEEQFYFIFPIIFWFCSFNKTQIKAKRNLLIVLLPLSILSLISFIYLYGRNQSAAYFLMPTRFWEIALGSISYLFYIQKNYISRKLEKINPTFLIILIIFLLFSPTSNAIISTILIALISSALIFCLKEGTLISNIFNRREILFIGKRSYSIYLWHWGVICFSKWTIGITWLTLPFQIIFILLLSIFSYEYVENPLRNKKFSNKIQIIRYFIFPVSLLALIIISMDLYLTKYIHRARIFLEGEKNVFLNEVNPNKNFYTLNEINNTSVNSLNCRDPLDIQRSLEVCSTKNEKANNLITMFGDSMNGSLLKLGEAFYENGNFNIINIYYGGQIFPSINYIAKENNFISMVNKSELIGQDKYFEYAIRELRKKKYTNKIILITNDFNFYFHGRRTNIINLSFYDSKNNIISTKDALKNWLKNLKSFVYKMQQENIKVVVLGSMPSFPERSTYPCFYRDILSNYLPLNLNICVDDLASRRKRINGIQIQKDFLGDELINISNSFDNFLYLDPTDFLCNNKKSCKAYDGIKLISHDGVHYSNNAAKQVYLELYKKLYKNNFID